MGDPKTCGSSFDLYGVTICRGGCKPCDPNDCEEEKFEKAFADIMKKVKEDDEDD